MSTKERPFYISLILWLVFFVVMALVLAYVKGDINV